MMLIGYYFIVSLPLYTKNALLVNSQYLSKSLIVRFKLSELVAFSENNVQLLDSLGSLLASLTNCVGQFITSFLALLESSLR
jgi:hypothetical protein